jgi:hypothetical protein
LVAVDEAPGRQRQVGLLVEIIVESCSCGLGSLMVRPICASVVSTGPQPAQGDASSQDSDRGHDVSIVMGVIGPVGR